MSSEQEQASNNQPLEVGFYSEEEIGKPSPISEEHKKWLERHKGEAWTLKEWAELYEGEETYAKLLELDTDIVTVREVLPREWLIEGLLPRKTLNFIGGDPGIGKTLLALQMAACLMAGQPFLGHKTNYARVLFVERDEGMEGIRDKIEKQSAKYSNLEELEIYKGELRADSNPDKLRFLVRYRKPEVLFIDSFSAIHYKDENSASEMRPILDCLRQLIDVFGITVVCIHHFTRTRAPRQRGHLRGSTVIEAQSDFALGMDRRGKELFLEPLKVRGEFEPIKLKLDKDTLTFNTSDEWTPARKKLQRQERVMELREAGANRREIIETVMREFGVGDKTVSRDLSQLKE